MTAGKRIASAVSVPFLLLFLFSCTHLSKKIDDRTGFNNTVWEGKASNPDGSTAINFSLQMVSRGWSTYEIKTRQAPKNEFLTAGILFLDFPIKNNDSHCSIREERIYQLTGTQKSNKIILSQIKKDDKGNTDEVIALELLIISKNKINASLKLTYPTNPKFNGNTSFTLKQKN